MIFLRENCKPVANPSATRLEKELSYTKSSYASLTADDGEYLQVAGGPGLFFLEQHSSSGYFRGFQDDPVAVHPDGTLLVFSAGSMQMARGEWFLRRQVIEVFVAFGTGAPWPAYLRWREGDFRAKSKS